MNGPSAVPNRVYVVHEDAFVCEFVEALVRDAGWEPLIFASAQDFLSHRCALCPSCLVLDTELSGLSCFDLQRRIVTERADIPIIFVSSCCEIPVVVRAIKAGAVEFLTKPLSANLILGAIRSALDRSRSMQGATSEVQGIREHFATLSNREREVMELVTSGLMNKHVAAELGISEVTVKAHRGRVMHKMQARSFADLMNICATLRLPPRAKFGRARRTYPGVFVGAEA